MFLKKLKLDNYKTYYGTQELNLNIPLTTRNESEKNIILIGGLNGAGKTTILKAIVYVLFGKRGISEQEYKKQFSNVINNNFYEEGGRDCSISLTIETDKGEEWELKVSWSFDNYKRVLNENREITVYKPGSTYGRHTNIDNMQAFDRFIDKVIPYHAAPFFIFDGEEIKDIILRQNSKEMKESIHKITGMDTYNLLIDDLKAISKKLEDDMSKLTNSKDIDKYQVNITKIDEQLTGDKDKLKKIFEQYNQLNTNYKELQQKRTEKLTQNMHSRERYIKKVEQKQASLNQLRKEKDLFIEEHLLKVILSKKIIKLQKRVESEKNSRNKLLRVEASLKPYHDFMNKLIEKNIDPPLTDDQLIKVRQLGEDIWLKDQNLKKQKVEELHDLSPKELSWIQSLKAPSIKKYKSTVHKIAQLEYELKEVEKELENAPDTLDVSEENKKIEDVTGSIKENELRQKALKKRVLKFEDDKTKLKNQITRMTEKVEGLEDVHEKYNNITGIINATEDFVNRSTSMKAHYIRDQFSYMLNKLFRKQNEFGKVDFDLDSYTVRIYNDKNQEISVQERSAGEMQMISSALIWALTKASDLELPVVIDTPLGRLDSYHRKHLIEHYYKFLSKQVIILSTDTEVTKEYVDLMKDNSYKQYMLDYDEEKNYTIIRDQYFDFINV
ncbi:DNA sulfur modification protein DndD [Salipaludibacillus daqingensis]|uniref:DNA sulfur modification protein DndD n=1 Tax=Salipaludibacillus daqingensis TaxID=3041001 RepID=UPI0024734B12|nr:DNA sulfur modification protein DndD [Salipaludibacillus daqingensis]